MVPFSRSFWVLFKNLGDILKVSQSNSHLFNIFMVNSQLFVGNGNRVHFWSDSWAGNLSIKSLFPRLFSLSSEKEITLRAVMDRRDAHSDGFLRFRRTLLSWESDELIRLEACWDWFF